MTADPWALLREAREFVERAAHVLEDPAYYADAKLFLARIDAALAASSSPVYREMARLDMMWQHLLRERDEAKAEARQAKALTNAAFQRGVETFRRHFHAFALGVTSWKCPIEAEAILDELPRMQVDDPEAK
jgi:hypothetical protein